MGLEEPKKADNDNEKDNVNEKEKEYCFKIIFMLFYIVKTNRFGRIAYFFGSYSEKRQFYDIYSELCSQRKEK